MNFFDTIPYPLVSKPLARRIADKRRRLDALQPLPAAALKKLREQVLADWTYNSNAIEGSTLTLRETELVLQEGVTIGGKSLREHFEAINHKDAILFAEALTRKKERLSGHIIRQLHALILKGIDDAEAGKYRSVQMRIAGAMHVPPNPSQVPALMGDFNTWLKRQDRTTDPVTLAALAHFNFVDIHPFIDGNGRTARLVMNLILMRRGFPPAVILKRDRYRYYRSLAAAHRGELKPFVNFCAQAVERSLMLYIEALTPIKTAKDAKKRRFLPLAEAAKLTPYSPKYLNLLARAGRLEAIKIGRNWVTTESGVRDYLESVAKSSHRRRLS